MADTELIPGVIRRDGPDGEFDELIMRDGDRCTFHAEMMDDRTMFVCLDPPEAGGRRVVMWIRSDRPLSVRVEED